MVCCSPPSMGCMFSTPNLLCKSCIKLFIRVLVFFLSRSYFPLLYIQSCHAIESFFPAKIPCAQASPNIHPKRWGVAPRVVRQTYLHTLPHVPPIRTYRQ